MTPSNAAVAKEFGVSAEWVRQIVGRSPQAWKRKLAAVKAAAAETVEAERRAKIDAVNTYILEHPDAPLQDIAAAAGVAPEQVFPMIHPDTRVHRLTTPTSGPSPTKFTNEEMLAVMKEASELSFRERGSVLTLPWYNDNKKPEWPAGTMYTMRFGSWGLAMREAGLETTRIVTGKPREDRIDEEQLLLWIAHFLNDCIATGAAPSAGMYTTWRSQQPDRGAGIPSLGLLRLRFGTWNSAKEKAAGLLDAYRQPDGTIALDTPDKISRKRRGTWAEEGRLRN